MRNIIQLFFVMDTVEMYTHHKLNFTEYRNQHHVSFFSCTEWWVIWEQRERKGTGSSIFHTMKITDEH
jgi:hypothetical protein